MTATRTFWLYMTSRFGSRKIIALASIFAVSMAFSIALAFSYGSFNTCSYGDSSCVVPCSGGVDAYGYVRCDGYVRGDAYVRCDGYVGGDGYVRADGYMGCNVNQDGYSLPGVGCDAYIHCAKGGCGAFVWPIQTDFTPPVIGNLIAQSVPCGTHITWTTDKPSTEQVFYSDMAGGPYSAAEMQYSGYRTDHDIELSGLSAGATYYYTVVSRDMAGNTTTSSMGSFVASESGKPSLVLSRLVVRWGSYSDYLARELSVDYSLSNTGTGRAYNLQVTGSNATQGVTLATEMPFALGELAAGRSTPLTLRYHVQDGVSRFTVATTASALDSCGNTFTYP